MTQTYQTLERLACDTLVRILPRKHNEIGAGLHGRTMDILISDVLCLHHIPNAFSFHRLTEEQQSRSIGGVEDLLFEDLPDALLTFYRERLEHPPTPMSI